MAVAQEPFVVSPTPVYELGQPYSELYKSLDAAKTALEQLAGQIPVLYGRPYVHQATAALEAFFGPNPADLIVSTGTGSGKTESFFMPIIAHLLCEAVEATGFSITSGM